MKVVELLSHKGVKLYMELFIVWAVLLGVLFVSINSQIPVMQQVHQELSSRSQGMIDSGLSTSQPANKIYTYTYKVVRGDSLTISYRRIVNKFMDVNQLSWSKGKRLYVEVNLVKYDTRINRNLNIGESVSADSDVVARRGTEFEALSSVAKQTWENDAKLVTLDASSHDVAVNLK